MNEDKLWRWIVRLTGLSGVFYGAVLNPDMPQQYLILFAAMIGLDQFVKGRDEKRQEAEDIKDVARRLAAKNDT